MVKFERCHVLLPSWPTNSISSGGPEGLLTFGTADGSFSSSFATRPAISSSWLVGRPVMVTIECLLSAITLLFASPATKLFLKNIPEINQITQLLRLTLGKLKLNLCLFNVPFKAASPGVKLQICFLEQQLRNRGFKQITYHVHNCNLQWLDYL